MADFSEMSLAELREEAKKLGFKGISAMRKQELVECLSVEKKTAQQPKEEPVTQTKEEPVAVEEPKMQGERSVAEVRRPVPSQERTQTAYGAQRRPAGAGAPSYVQQPRPSYNAQQQTSSYNTQQQQGGYSAQNQQRPVQQVPQGDQQAQKGPSPQDFANMTLKELEAYDSGETKTGILEIMPEGFGFIRCDNYLPGENDVYVGTPLLRKYGLRTGDIVSGNTKVRTVTEKFSPLLYVKSINGYPVVETPMRRPKFEHLTPIFPNERIHLETPGCPLAMRMVDLISPIGKGQRGMIVSQPKTGKTTLLKQVAKAITRNHKDMYLIIL